MRASWQPNEELLFFIEERLSKLVVGECSSQWQANEELLFFIEERLSKLVVGECSSANTKTDNSKMEKLL